MSYFLLKRYSSRFFSRKQTGKINIFISPASRHGGGSNTFTGNFDNWINLNSAEYRRVYKIQQADLAVIIANRSTVAELAMARNAGCFIIHRLDEHIENNNLPSKKHSELKELNKYADVTVYQSQFVYNNMHPFLGEPANSAVIHNGAFADSFYPAEKPGQYIGHVTWSVHRKKRLDLLYEFIQKHPEEQFLLVGNHNESPFDFKFPNVTMKGKVNWKQTTGYYRMMKMLYFPSEKDPCSNTVVESILSGVPVCYNSFGGNIELVKDCGEPLEKVNILIKTPDYYRSKCFSRKDLHFDSVAKKYLETYSKLKADCPQIDTK